MSKSVGTWFEKRKELYLAKFPMKHDWVEGKHTIHCSKCSSNKTLGDYEPCNPSLSELIKACGEDLYSLNRKAEWIKIDKFDHLKKWYITSSVKTKLGLDHIDYPAFGSDTPEESVANLWLALNG